MSPCVNVLTIAELNKAMFVFQCESTGVCFHFFCSHTALRPVDLPDTNNSHVLVCKYFKGSCFRRTFVIEYKSKQIIYAGQEIQGAVSAVQSQ